MALIIQTHLVCDRCGKSEFGKDNPDRTGSQQRQIAQNNGWVKSSYKDICPNCHFKKGSGNKAKLLSEA